MSEKIPQNGPTLDTEEMLKRLAGGLPFSQEAESGLVSCLLQDPEEGLGECRLDIPAEALYCATPRVVYTTMLAMADSSPPVPINPVTLCNVLRDQGLLDGVGGASAVSEFYTYVPTASSFDYFRRVIREKWRLRNLLRAMGEIGMAVREHGNASPNEKVDDLISMAQEKIFALSATTVAGDGGQDYKEVLNDVLDRVEEQLKHTGTIPADRVPFGLCDLDRMVWGFVRGQLVILAGRPSMGKSALAKDIYGNVSRGLADYAEWDRENPATGEKTWPHRHGKHVMVINQEMTNVDSVTRDLVGGAGINLTTARYGIASMDGETKLTREWQGRLQARHREIYQSNIRMYDAPGMSIQHLRALARARKRKHGLDLVVIDYLQLMHSESSRARGNRQQEIAEISGGLKEMAKELDCVVLALAQLSRTVEERKDKVPILADLRESGSMEQDADVVMFIHRPWYYDKDTDDPSPPDEAALFIAKGRNVGVGKIDLKFAAHLTTFTSTTFHLLSTNEDRRQQ